MRYYIEQYYTKVLCNINPEKILENEYHPILLCYEQPLKFCHRHILAEYLNIIYNINVKEIYIDRNLNITELNRMPSIRKMLEQVMK